jgi:hypothetical protein
MVSFHEATGLIIAENRRVFKKNPCSSPRIPRRPVLVKQILGTGLAELALPDARGYTLAHVSSRKSL